MARAMDPQRIENDGHAADKVQDAEWLGSNVQQPRAGPGHYLVHDLAYATHDQPSWMIFGEGREEVRCGNRPAVGSILAGLHIE